MHLRKTGIQSIFKIKEEQKMRAFKFFNRNWMLLFVGVAAGIVLVTGFGWTHSTHAQEMATSQVPQAVTAPVASPQDYSTAKALSNVFADVAARVNPSVVMVFTETDVKVANSPFEQFFGGDDFFKKFFQQPSPDKEYKQMGLGSGVIVDPNGIILTNNHVVDDADNIKVKLMDGREFKGKVKGKDPQTDLAVVMIDAKDLTPMKLGDSDQARVGDMVLAIGSPLNPELEHTVTSGIISAKGRSGVGLSQYEDYIQTDAAINPGNSGGALVNLDGQLIGINTAIASQTGGFMGIGFAIPVNLARKVMDDIIKNGKVIRGWLGVYIQNITPELAKALKLNTTKGVLVSKVQDGSPAEKAGIKAEDVILAYNGKTLNNSTELSTWVASTSPDTKVAFTVLRDGDEKTITVKLGELNTAKQAVENGQGNYNNIGMQVTDLGPETIGKYHLSKDEKGVVVTGVNPSGAAASVGIQEGDVIMSVNRVKVESVQDFDKVVSKLKAGDDILFYLRRGPANLFVAFTLPENK
jgi:serine protease Do